MRSITSSRERPVSYTHLEVRKLDNKKCLIFIRGFDPIMDNKYSPFGHPAFAQTADGRGKPYVHIPVSYTHLEEDRELLSAYMKKLNLLVKEAVETIGNQ